MSEGTATIDPTEALKIDENDGPPLWRGVPTWTPPIPGFDPSEFIQEDE